MRGSSRIYADRRAAGLELARAVSQRHPAPPVVVLGLPRGGVPVAVEVARELHAPLDVMVVRKVGMPGQPELAIGAVASGGITVRTAGLEPYLAHLVRAFDTLVQEQQEEVRRRERRFRGDRAPLDLHGKCVILVDDGIATGSTMIAAVRAARQAGASRVVVAAPVSSQEARSLLQKEADAVVLLQTPDGFRAVGEWYEDFTQVEDEDVTRLLQSAPAAQDPRAPPGAKAGG